MKLNKSINGFLTMALIFICSVSEAQITTTEYSNIPTKSTNLYAGIEIGAKAVKISVLELINANKGNYNVIASWNENTNVGTGISINKMIADADIDKTAQIVQKSYQKLINEFKINHKKIFVVISSGIGVAKNINDLESFIETLIQKKPVRIGFEDEAKFLIKGSIPINNYDDSMVFDIGGGNSKGGIVTKLAENNNYLFVPMGLNYGTVTLTDKIKVYNKKTATITDYLTVSEKYNDSIKNLLFDVINKNPLIQKRKNIYISGGAIWSFVTLSKGKSDQKFVPFTIQDVRNYGLDLYLNYSKYEKLAKTNPDVDIVLKTYSQLYLISGNNILLKFLENIDNIEDKKIYFVNQGYVSWLKSYILETVNQKVKY